MRKFRTTIALLLTMISLSQFQAQTSNLSIQGVLRNANGTAVENGKYDITFRLWDAPTNGTMVWEEEKTQVDVEGGIYSVVLGDGATALDADFTEQYFLGVAVEGGTELIPRASLTSSPYALSLIGNDNIFPNSGNVGVGAAQPQNKLTVQRGNAILGLEADSLSNNTSTITTTDIGMQFDAGGTDKAYTFQEGNVGIGTDTPLTVLHLKSNAELLRLEGSDQAYFSFYKDGGATQSGWLGYGDTGTSFSLNNEVGELDLIGNGIQLNAGSGNVQVNNSMNVTGEFIASHNAEMVKFVGTDRTYLGFYPQGIAAGRKGYIGFPTANGDNMYIAAKNSSSSGRIILKGDSDVVEIPSRLNVTSHISHAYQQIAYLRWNNTGNYGSNNTYPYKYSITVSQNIGALQFHAFSDKRIKKDFSLSDGKEDLATLKKIEVTDYRHIDEVENGKDFKKGLVAQQVKSVFPEAVTLQTKYIPNVMSASKEITARQNQLTITLDKPHDFAKGDNIKLFSSVEDKTKIVVSEIIDEFTFVIPKGNLSAEDELFIYGKEVDDFHAVDYDRVFTLAVSATQELARKVEALEKENAVLKKKSANVERANVNLKAELQGMNKRLEEIELLVGATGKK